MFRQPFYRAPRLRNDSDRFELLNSETIIFRVSHCAHPWGKLYNWRPSFSVGHRTLQSDVICFARRTSSICANFLTTAQTVCILGSNVKQHIVIIDMHGGSCSVKKYIIPCLQRLCIGVRVNRVALDTHTFRRKHYANTYIMYFGWWNPNKYVDIWGGSTSTTQIIRNVMHSSQSEWTHVFPHKFRRTHSANTSVLCLHGLKQPAYFSYCNHDSHAINMLISMDSMVQVTEIWTLKMFIPARQRSLISLLWWSIPEYYCFMLSQKQTATLHSDRDKGGKRNVHSLLLEHIFCDLSRVSAVRCCQIWTAGLSLHFCMLLALAIQLGRWEFRALAKTIGLG